MIANADIRAHSLLNEVYADRKVGAEIGVYRGDLSWRLLGSHDSLHLIMVDPWRANVSDSYSTTDDHIARQDQAQHDENMRVALAQVRPFAPRFTVKRMTSLKAALEVEDASLDFVFIDGDHSYEGCSADIAAWWPKVKAGGILSGHDYRDERNYGVIPAVQEFSNNVGISFRLGGNYTWFLTRP